MRSTIHTRWLAAPLAVACLLGLSGCILTVESDSHFKHGQEAIESLAAIRAGVTTREWVVEHLGVPNSSHVNADGNEVLSYVSLREQETEVSLLLLFSFDVSEQELHTLHIEIEDDCVKSYWIE